MSLTTEELNRRFTFNFPKDNQIARLEEMRRGTKQLCLLYKDQVQRPGIDSREFVVALTKLQEALMWVNLAITQNE